jgi:hypothetical protein
MSKARELSQRAGVDGALSNRNLIINGAMQVAQRGTSWSVPNNYTLDRWKSLRYLYGNYTVSQQDTGGLSGFSKCIRVQRNSGTSDTTEIAINQPVESLSSKHLAGKVVTLSFWARVGSDYAGQAGYFISAVAYTTNGSDIGMYYDNFYSNGTALRQVNTPSTSWTYYTMTVTIPSSANQVGVAFSTQSWTGTAGANDYYEITGVQLEVGDTATPFEHRSYGQELALCQRYYEKSYGDGVALGTATQGGMYIAPSSNYNSGAVLYGPAVRFAVAKRSSPSFSFWSYTGLTNNWHYGIAGFSEAVSNAPTPYAIATSSFYPYILSVGSTSNIMYGQWAADAEL